MTALYLILAFIALLAACTLAIGYKLFSEFVHREGKFKEKFAQEGAGTHREWILSRAPEELVLQSRDALSLHAIFLRAESPADRTVILLHGYLGCGIDHMGMFAPFYLAQGFNVCLPDLRAHGESGGKYIGFGLLDSTDVLDWCDYLLRRFGAGHKLLIHGVSMGASTAGILAGNERLPAEVRGIVSDCAFSSCEKQFTHSLKYITPVSAKLLLPVADLWCRALAHYSLYEASAEKHIAASSLPFLFIHGAEDTFVPTEMGKTLCAACPDPEKELWIVPGAKHFLSYQVDQAGYEERLRAFFDRIGI